MGGSSKAGRGKGEIAESGPMERRRADGTSASQFSNQFVQREHLTLDWRPGCKCVTLSDVPIVEGLSCYEPYPPIPCVVLDPFVGSGTVLAVTAQLGRHGIGIDLSETYLRDIAIPRLEEILLQPKLFMPEQPTAGNPKQEQLL